MANSSLKRSAIAGFTTFFTLAYLLILYPQIMSEGGFDLGATLVAQVATLVFSTLFLALYANFPAVIAPGLSVATYLIFSAIQQSHLLPSEALGIVFWSGLAVFSISALKLRQKILIHLPDTIKFAAIGGIGLFLICIGLKNLGIFSLSRSEPVRFSQVFTLPSAIAFFGLALFYLLHRMKIQSAFLATILGCWALALLFGQTQIGKIAAWPPSIEPSLLRLDFSVILRSHLWGPLLSVFLISLFDSTASLTALSRLNSHFDATGKIRSLDKIVLPDGLGSMLAGLLGATSLSFTLESSSGIKAGGRTGATAIVAALCCLLGLFFFPLISSIPLFATTPALIAIGVFMAKEAKEIRWREWSEAIPALLTLLCIPLTFDIYRGFAFGFISYACIKALTGRYREVHPICWGLAFIFASHLLWTITASQTPSEF